MQIPQARGVVSGGGAGDFAQEDGAAVTHGGVVLPELKSGIGHRVGSDWPAAEEKLQSFLAPQPVGVES